MKLPTNYNKLSSLEKREAIEKYIDLQNKLCYYCKKSLAEEPVDMYFKYEINKKLFPEGFFKYPIHLHHDHDTEMTLGAVHNYCNAILWQYHNE